MQPDVHSDSSICWQSKWLQHMPWLRTMLSARLADAISVEEVLQDVAVTAWRKREQLADPDKMAPWLYRIAIRKVQQFWKTTSIDRKRFRARPALDWKPAKAQPDPANWIIAEEAHELVRSAMRELAAQDREILMLKHTENWTYAELSAHLGLTTDKVIYRLSRARRRLREKLLSIEQDWD